MMIIRKLENKDLESLSRLYYQFWGENSDLEAMEKTYNIVKNNDNYMFLVAEVDGEIAGSIMGVVCTELYGACRPFLLMEDLIVDKCFRKRGIGKSLLTALENEGRKRNCYQILFLTEKERLDAVSFYESAGYDSKKNKGFKKQL